MSRLFRQAYTKPIPPDAKIILHKGKKSARFVVAGETITAPLTTKGDKIRLESSKWYGEYIDANGQTVREPLSTDKDAAQLMLAEKVRKAELEKVGIVNKYETHLARPLAQHIDDFEAMLTDKGVSKKQTEQKPDRVRKLLVTYCGFASLTDIDEQAVQKVAREQAWSDQTRRHYLSEAKSFTAWLFRTRRVQYDPLAIMTPPKVRKIVRQRRPLLENELRSLLETTRASEWQFRGLTGGDRAMLYTMAVYSGFRAEELSKLTPQHLRLNDTIPHVFLAGKDTKNGKPARQAIPAGIAQDLAAYVGNKPPQQPIWAGTWRLRASKMLKRDLKAAGIAIAVNKPEGKLVLDFHSLRHSFIRMLSQAGIPLRRAMQLARHSDPKLTAVTYGSEELAELATAVNLLPDLLKRELSDRNRHLAIRHMLEVDLPSLPPAYREFAAASPELAGLWAESYRAMEHMDEDETMDMKRFMYKQYLAAISTSLRPAGFEPATLGLGNRNPSGEGRTPQDTCDESPSSLPASLPADQRHATIIRALPWMPDDLVDQFVALHDQWLKGGESCAS